MLGVTATTRDGTSTASANQNITISFAAVSEEPVVSIGGDLTGLNLLIVQLMVRIIR